MVRMKRTKEGLTILGASESPALVFSEGEEGSLPRLHLSKRVRAKSAALTFTAQQSIIRLLNLPGFSQSAATADQTVREHVGLEKDFRLGYTVASQQRGRAEVSLVAVGVPEVQAANLLALPGSPSPVSVEVSALSSLTGFVRGPAAQVSNGPVGLVEAGAQVTCLTIFNQGAPVLLRKFDFGGDQILQRVQRQFGVDDETARNMLVDQSFDVSHSVQEVMGAFLRQLSISKEFVERKVGKSVVKWYAAGGLVLIPYWKNVVEGSVGQVVQPWNPLENLYMMPDAWPEALEGNEVRFSAAIGAAIGALEGS
jgi:Tfp pilus assembly PilM family ATPase